MSDPHVGSTFDSFLEAEGLLEEVHNVATKHVLAWQIERAMQDQRLTKTAMAKRMNTSRAQLDRLLDPANMKVQIDTIEKAAHAVGRRLVIELRDDAA